MSIRNSRTLRWQEPGQRHLADSHAMLTVPHGYIMAAGADANLAEILLGRANTPHLEATMLNRGNHFVFQYFDLGYVPLDDWGALDADKMLAGIRAGTESGNGLRRGMGADEIHVIGWLKPPYLDRASASVYWAVNATEGKAPLLNFVVLRLSRGGFEQVTWAADKADNGQSTATLEAILAGFNFDAGHRYADHASGDGTAAVGIGALVADITEGKPIPPAVGGGLASLLASFSKLGVFGYVLIGALAGGLAVLLRRLLGGKKILTC